jgi:hypothetical protein
MEKKTTIFEPLVKEATELLNSSVELYTYKLTKKGVSLSASLVFKLMVSFLTLLIIFFFSLALALYLGNLLQNLVYGFLIVASFMLLMVLLLLIFKFRISTLVFNYFLKSAFK